MNLRSPFNLVTLKLVQQGARKGGSLESGYQVFFWQALFSENDKKYKELQKITSDARHLNFLSPEFQ